MFRTLVVPLDGSQLAELALPFAVQLAQASHARVVLMQAVPARLPGLLDRGGTDGIEPAASVEARQYLCNTAQSLSAQEISVDIALPHGRPTEKILETMSAFQADGVVMTTHGRTGFDHLLHGSVTEAILARSNVPVFVVHTRPGQAPAPTFPFARARLLVPQDGSEYDAAALGAALEMLGPQGEIVLVMVARPPEHVVLDDTRRRVLAYLDQQVEAVTLQVRDYLAGVAAPLRNSSSPISVKIDVRIGDPARGIAMAALDTQADLIVMATHGRTGIERAVVGSVAGTVLRTACTPVVLVHPCTPTSDGGIEQPEVGVLGPIPTF
jgi:nucleotide-binding universal stress UspA family protein